MFLIVPFRLYVFLRGSVRSLFHARVRAGGFMGVHDGQSSMAVSSEKRQFFFSDSCKCRLHLAIVNQLEDISNCRGDSGYWYVYMYILHAVCLPGGVEDPAAGRHRKGRCRVEDMRRRREEEENREGRGIMQSVGGGQPRRAVSIVIFISQPDQEMMGGGNTGKTNTKANGLVF